MEDRPRLVLKQPNRKLSPAEIDELVTAYEAGAAIAHLSSHFGMHRQTVRFHLKRRAIALRSDTPALTSIQIDEVTKLYATGLSTAKIGGRFGVSASTVQKALHARGVRLRPPADRRHPLTRLPDVSSSDGCHPRKPAVTPEPPGGAGCGTSRISDCRQCSD